METQDAPARLRRMVAAGTEPVLEQADLDVLLRLASRRDLSGRYTSDVGWVPTYDLAAAAAEGWRWKAAQAAFLTDVKVGDLGVTRSQLHDHCLSMAAIYARRISTTQDIYAGAVDLTGAVNL